MPHPLQRLTKHLPHPAPDSVTYPLMERLWVATVLATIGGSLNVWALMNAGAFTTSQSGNIVASSLYLATGDWDHFFFVWGSVMCFALGVFISGTTTFRTHARNRSYSALILSVEAVTIATLALLWALQVIPTTTVGARIVALIISFIAGVQGPAFRRVDGTSYSSVSIVMELQGLFTTLAQPAAAAGLTTSQRRGLVSRYFFTLAGFAVGALITGGLGAWAGWEPLAVRGNPVSGTGWSLLFPAFLSAVLVAMALYEKRSHVRLDPTDEA